MTLILYNMQWLRGHVATWLLGYVAMWLRGYAARWLCGYVATRLRGYAATRLRGYGDVTTRTSLHPPNLKITFRAYVKTQWMELLHSFCHVTYTLEEDEV